MHPVETYLKTLSEIHDTGGATAETSYYAAFETLLNEVGAKLKPKVRAVAQLSNMGAGSPDFGLFTANQFQRAKADHLIAGAIPERGVVEVKGWKDNSFVTAETKQVATYWDRYNLVLVTNYRDFVLIGRDRAGRPQRLETYRMAGAEEEFRVLLAHPRKTAIEQGERLLEFLRRVLLYEAVLANPEDLAWFLASYAREARCRVEASADLPALEGLKNALENALGMTFEGQKGAHFFQATLVQTLFYGVFSSWVLWCRDQQGRPETRFDWHNAAWTLHVPMVAGLFSQIATPQKLKPLGVAEVLDWAGAALNRVDRPAFFSRFEEEHAVQYFYEPFLKAYDPELRKELGVWYTPPEIVEYQVERVDRVLREELNIPDGLADDRVIILDPCCGTGAYLVETLQRIHKTFVENGGGALIAQKLKRAAMMRVFGFELLPAPFVVAHLQIGLMLRRLGAPLDYDGNQRAGIYLTNALTGWEPLEKPKDELPFFPELMEERDAANRVKQEARILVILGNPPYNAYAGVSPEEEGGLVEPYKEGLTTPVEQGGWGIKKFNLDDLYVRFFRIAERRIVKSGRGIVCFISNNSYLRDPSFVVMRRRFLREFDRLWFDCMNGDSRETGKLTPEGRPDPSVFSTKKNPVGIRVGTAIVLMVRADKRARIPAVRFRHYWGVTKRRDLLASLKSKNFDRNYKVARPVPENRYSFEPRKTGRDYQSWPRVVDFCAIPPSNGLMEKRGGALMDSDPHSLAGRMKAYFNTRLEWDVVRGMIGGLAHDAARYDARKTRQRLLAEEYYDESRIVRYALRPFDTLWCYYSAVRPLWNEPRPSYRAQCWEGNAFFMTRPAGVAHPEGVPVCFTRLLGDNDFQRGHAYYFPIRIREGHLDAKGRNNHQGSVFEEEEVYATYRANLSGAAREYLAKLGVFNPDTDSEAAELLWMHALAIGFSSAYLKENADGIRQDWPRIPLAANKKTLFESAALGRRIAELLDTEKPVEGVTHGTIPQNLRALGTIQKMDGGQVNPEAGDLDITAGWGHWGKQGVCMPGKGKQESYCVLWAEALSADHLKRLYAGEYAPDSPDIECVRIFLNSNVYWDNVPLNVWNFTIGGYQVIKKWLSYREKEILSRGLTMDEAEYVTAMVRRIAALVELEGALDNNYLSARSESANWPMG